MKILIKNAAVVNAAKLQKSADILIEDGVITDVKRGINEAADRVVEAKGLYAFPGFFDLHAHLRDPGFKRKEDIESGTRSAAAGGFTSVCCMPNTKPPIDSARTVKYILKQAEKLGACEVLPVACITKGMRGGELTDFAALRAAGAVAFSDDGMPVEDDEVILAAMAQAKEQKVLLMLHEENLKDRGRGVANEGENARKAKLHGIPAALEDGMTARDIFYAQRTGAQVHICHVSTAGSVELVRRAKANGIPVTCETAPHYFSLTDEEILGKNPNAKVNPPLRSGADRQAVIEGIADGTIDAIATDHAPHTESEKKRSFAHAPFGLIGFETAFSLAVTHLYRPGTIRLEDIARLMSAAPRTIARHVGGEVRKGMPADIVLTDIEASFVYTQEEIVSKAKNSPFIGKQLYGRVMLTIAGGKVTYDRQADRQDH